MNRRMHVVQMAAEGGEGGGGGDNTITPEVQAQIDAAVASAVSAATTGLDAKNKELLGKLKLKDGELEKFKGIDPEKTRQLLAKFENDEEAQLIAVGKMDEVVNRRIEKQKSALESAKTEAEVKAQKAEERAKKHEMQVLKGQLMEAASDKEVGMHASATKYAFLIAMQDGWRLDEDGIARQYKDNEVVLGADGKTPYSLKEWLSNKETIKENPTWYLAGNSGGGSGGNTENKGDKNTMKRSAFEALGQRDRAAFIKGGGKVVDD